MAEHDLFKFELQEREPEIEDTLKANKRLSIAPTPMETSTSSVTGAGPKKRGSVGGKLKMLQSSDKQ